LSVAQSGSQLSQVALHAVSVTSQAV